MVIGEWFLRRRYHVLALLSLIALALFFMSSVSGSETRLVEFHPVVDSCISIDSPSNNYGNLDARVKRGLYICKECWVELEMAIGEDSWEDIKRNWLYRHFEQDFEEI